MKTLSQHLKQAFNALEFANTGHLHALTAKLNQPPAWNEDHYEGTDPTQDRAVFHSSPSSHKTFERLNTPPRIY